eukprot:Lithocolla_globosa_v1_NODE_165_length_5553_cov_13.632479.p6 type:complete len:144 gc:universal NODE_165_length_5553_cov_13.632479:5450-5019(-)
MSHLIPFHNLEKQILSGVFGDYVIIASAEVQYITELEVELTLELCTSPKMPSSKVDVDNPENLKFHEVVLRGLEFEGKLYILKTSFIHETGEFYAVELKVQRTRLINTELTNYRKDLIQKVKNLDDGDNSDYISKQLSILGLK